ncbi:hypothetical protein BH18THE2_BH18THE2_43800 [soil metagenome]
MPNISTRLGQYCISHGYIHEEEYLECDYCNEHKSFISLKDRNYNYGFSRRSYLACDDCHFSLFGPFRLVDGDVMDRAYESILDVINDRTEKKGYETIDYYEAVSIAYTESEYIRKHFDSPKGINNLKKDNKALWEFTYRIVSREEKERVKVVNKDPDNLLVSWVPGGRTMTEILKAMRVEPVRI